MTETPIEMNLPSMMIITARGENPKYIEFKDLSNPTDLMLYALLAIKFDDKHQPKKQFAKPK